MIHIPGENPSPFTLCGTNCFIVGKGKKRSLIEAGDYPEKNMKFLENLKKYISDNEDQIEFENIFITHAHHDHLGGLLDVLKLLESLKLKEPNVFKYLDGSHDE